MDNKICPIFYAVMLHRRGRVDDITQNDLCMCLGERCMWFNKCNKESNMDTEEEDKVPYTPEDEEILDDEEDEEEDEKSTPLFADDESEFSKI